MNRDNVRLLTPELGSNIPTLEARVEAAYTAGYRNGFLAAGFEYGKVASNLDIPREQ